MFTPLPWQEDVLQDYIAKAQKDYVLVAGTGCGKTIAGTLMASHTFRTIGSAVILVLAPYRSIKIGWIKAMKKAGLNVASKPEDIAPDTDVYVSTYAGARGALKTIREYVDRKLILVFDEFHHMEENSAWGDPFISMSDGEYAKRIFLSGTPWHETGKLPESMVEYDSDGCVIHDKKYTYGENVNGTGKEVNTVPVRFNPVRITRTIFYKDKKTGKPTDRKVDTKKASRGDSLGDFVGFSSTEEFENNNGLVEILSGAVDRLREIRAYQMPKAGGIVFVKDKSAGLMIQQYMAERLQTEAILIVSDDPKSHARLKAFNNSYDNWIIAIDMVSEGVDIPRLKVVADLTNRKTLLHIIQRWGRVLRLLRHSDGKIESNNSDAHIFYVAHPQLSYVAKEIERDVKKYYKVKTKGEEPPESNRVKVGSHGTGIREDLIFKHERIEAEIDLLANWLINTNYNGVADAKYTFLQAITLAKILISNGDTPSEFVMPDVISSNRDMKESMDRMYKFIPAKCKREGVDRTSRLTGRIANRHFDGDYASANRHFQRETGEYSWTSNNKELSEINSHLEKLENIENALG